MLPPIAAGGSIPVCDFMTGVAVARQPFLSLYGRDRVSPVRAASPWISRLYEVAFSPDRPLLSYFRFSRGGPSRGGESPPGGAPTGHS